MRQVLKPGEESQSVPGRAALERDRALAGHTGRAARKIPSCQSLIPWSLLILYREI